MPSFHFNVFDGTGLIDKEESELATFAEARLEAIRRTGRTLLTDPARIDRSDEWRMDVTDHTGLILLRLDFCMIETAATMALNMRDAQSA